MQRSLLLFYISSVFAFATFGTSNAMSAQSVTMPTSVAIQPGLRTTITVAGELSGPADTSSRIGTLTIQYPAHLVRIVGVYGGAEFGFRCPFPIDFTTTITSSRTGLLEIVCWDIQPKQGAPLLEIEMEGLAGPVDTGMIVARTFQRKGEIQPDIVMAGGTISRTDAGPVPASTLEERIVNVAPNPMSTDARVEFVAVADGQAHMSIYDCRALLIKDYPPMQVSAGTNSIQLHADFFELANGAYVVQIVTDAGVSLYPVVVMR